MPDPNDTALNSPAGEAFAAPADAPAGSQDGATPMERQEPHSPGTHEQAGGDTESAAFDVPGDDAHDGGDGGSEQEAAPGQYEAFNLPDGVTIPGDRMETFSAWARGSNLSQAQAQQAIDLYTRVAGDDKATAEGLWQEQAAAWTRDAKGAGLLNKETLVPAQAGLEKADPTGSLGARLRALGLDHHPGIIKVFAAYGKATSNDSEVPNPAIGGNTSEKSRKVRLYPDMAKKE